MQFIELLKDSAEKNKSIVCMGLDPVLERIPVQGSNVEQRIVDFYSEIINACVAENCLPAAFKPNYAFYAQYGFAGLRALKKVISICKETSVPVILDAKRSDIGKSCIAYAKELFDFWQADACTVQAFLGRDSIEPFLEFCVRGKGVYVLTRSSNPGAEEFQNLCNNSGEPLYITLAKKLLNWASNCKGNLGSIVGATSLPELGQIVKTFKENPSIEIPLLIPGVGAQGGSASDTAKVLKNTGYNLAIVRINSSSGLNYAYERFESEDFAGSTVKALKELNREIGFK
jgi:orotidine-5'-phosphate decarboxylase